MSTICDHAGWGMYRDEVGRPCPPPTEMHVSDDGIECPACGYHVKIDRNPSGFAPAREIATAMRETR